MSSTVLSYLEIVVILSTAVMLGVTIYQVKKKYSNIHTVFSGISIIFGFAICVVMSSLEKERITQSPAVWCAVALFAVMTIALLVTMNLKKEVRPGNDAVIEAFDKIDIGVCYYDSHGRVVLCNEYMHRVSVNAFGIRVLNGLEFKENLEAVWVGAEQENIYEFRSENRWYSVHTGEVVIGNESLAELIVIDVTDLKDKKDELESNNSRLIEMNRCLSEYGAIADTVIREQEILNAKIKIHDRFGDLLITARRAMEENVTDEDIDKIVAYMRNTLSYMTPQGDSSQEDDFEELVKAADSIGVQIHINGTLPNVKATREIVLLGIRECLTNTVKHADGHHLFVDITSDEKTRVVITNDGEKPKGAVTLGTGLSSLKMKAEKAGGSIRILTDNGFVLKIDV